MSPDSGSDTSSSSSSDSDSDQDDMQETREQAKALDVSDYYSKLLLTG